MPTESMGGLMLAACPCVGDGAMMAMMKQCIIGMTGGIVMKDVPVQDIGCW